MSSNFCTAAADSYIVFISLHKLSMERRPSEVDDKEKKKDPWILSDPKPPVIRSGHMEAHLQKNVGIPPVNLPGKIL